jgi:hypothetical protein
MSAKQDILKNTSIAYEAEAVGKKTTFCDLVIASP